VDPKTTVAPAGADLRAVVAFLDALEEHEDIVRVFSNAELDFAQLEALA
jgi:transcriptional/translational regulatory protein YebC/TACO1